MYDIIVKNDSVETILDITEIESATVTREKNKSDSAEIEVSKNLDTSLFVPMQTLVTVKDDEEIIFRGRIVDAQKDIYNNLSISCEGALSYLNDTLYAPFEFSGTPDELLSDVLDNHNSNVEDDKKIYLGEVTVEDPNDYIARSSESYLCSLEVINTRLISGLDGYLVVRYEDDLIYLDWLAEQTHVNDQSIELGSNLMDVEIEYDYQDVITRLIPLGAEDEDTGEILDVSSVNNGVLYIEDEDAIEKYGIITGTNTWDDVTIASNLLTKAEAFLENNSKAKCTITINAVDLNMIDSSIEKFHLGDWILVNIPTHDIFNTYQLSKIEYDILEPQNSTITLGDVEETSTSYTRSSVSEVSSSLTQYFNSISAIKANFTSLSATVATISEAYITEAQVGTLIAEYGYLTTAEVETLIAGYGYIDSLTVNNLLANYVETADLVSNYITAADIESMYVTTSQLSAEIAEISTLFADYATVDQLDAVNADITNLETSVATIRESIIDEADIRTMIVDYAYITEADVDTILANKAYITDAEVQTLIAEYGYLNTAEVEELIATYGYITSLEVDDLLANYASINYLTTNYLDSESINSTYATIEELETNYITASTIEGNYIKVDLSNFTTTMVGTLLADSGLVTNMTINEGYVTGMLSSVEINADLITAGTLSVQRLIITGEDGLIYQLNLESSGLSTTVLSSETYQNYINGTVIVARSITADQIAAGTITANEIAANTITASNIVAGTITATEIDMSSLVADQAFITAISTNSVVVSAYDTANGSVKSVTFYYALGTSETTAPTSGWSTTAPEWQDGYYIWQKTVTLYNDGTSDESEAVCITGASGSTGNGVESITKYYAISTSCDVVPTASMASAVGSAIVDSACVGFGSTVWTTEAPTLTETFKYLWSYEDIVYTDGTTQSTYPYVIGVYGDTGETGADGTGVNILGTAYTATSSDEYVIGEEYVLYSTSGYTTQITDPELGDSYLVNGYLFVCTDTSGLFTCAGLIQGEDGVGIRSVSEYYALSTSSATVTGTWSTVVPTLTATDKYLWNYEVIYYTDSTSTTTAQRVIGVYGDTGSSGEGVETIVKYYALGSSGTVVPEDSMSACVDSAIVGTSCVGYGATVWSTETKTVTELMRYLWSYEDITYTDGSVQATDPCVIGVYGSTGSAGVGISSIVAEYYLSTSRTTCTGGSWSTNSPTWESGYYIWTRSLITWDDGTTSYTDAVLDSSLNSIGEAATEASETVSTWKYADTTYIDGGNIYTGTITADALNVNKLSAIAADLGDITAGSININNKFIVTSDGDMTATSASITGEITATSGYIGGTSGLVITSTGLYYGTSSISSTTAGTYMGRDGFRQYSTSSQYVNITNGILTAYGAVISGKLAAGSGSTIGGFTIGTSAIYSNSHTAYNTAVDGVYIGTDYISLGSGGVVYFSKTGTGKIGGFTFSATALYKSSSVTSGTSSTQYQMYLNAPSSVSNSTVALYLRNRSYDGDSTYGSWTNNFYVRYDGYIYAIGGGRIGGWTIGSGTSGAIYNGCTSMTSTTAGTYIGTSGIRQYASSSAYVNIASGILTAYGATISGKITATSGTIGGWTITSTKIYSGSSSTGVAVMQAPTSSNTYVFAAGGTSHDSYTDCPFRVTKAGKLYSTSAEIGGWTVSEYALKAGSESYGTTCMVQVPQDDSDDSSNRYWVFAAGGSDHSDHGDCIFRVGSAGEMYVGKTLIRPKTSYTTSNTGRVFQVQSTKTNSWVDYDTTTALLVCGVDSTSGYVRSYPTYRRTYSSSANMHITESGTFGRYSSSSARYKNTINYFTNSEYASEYSLSKAKNTIDQEDFENSMKSILNLPVVEFHYNDGYMTGEPDYDYSKYEVGFIAEDVEKNVPDATQYNEDGSVEMWNVNKIVPRMLFVIQQQEKRINELEKLMEEKQCNYN